MKATRLISLALTLPLALAPLLAQDPNGWRKFDPRTAPPQPAPPPPMPPTLTIPAGKYITVRTSNFLSSDKNHPGDAFVATLAEPIVVDGFVVAGRGQTVEGRVVEAVKAGRVKGTSRLRVELIVMSLADGQQVPLKTQLIQRNGNTSVGRDVGAVAETTAVGALIGAGVNGGVGAGVGAGAGLVVSLVGVLLTRGHPTIVFPETVLTFRQEAPISVSTAHSGYAIRPVGREDYERPAPRLVRSGCYGCPLPPRY